MKGRLAFVGAQQRIMVNGERCMTNYRGHSNSQAIASTAHIKKAQTVAIVLPSGVKLTPFLTDDERRRAYKEWQRVGFG